MAKVTASAGFDAISGKYGPSVVANGPTGLVLRRPPSYRRPTSPGQQAAAERMALAAGAWNELTYAQARAWDDYAKTQRRTNPTNGRTYSPTGFTTFCGLAVRVLHVDPMAEIPTNPPVFPFVGDEIGLEAVGVGDIRLTRYDIRQGRGNKRGTINDKRNGETRGDERQAPGFPEHSASGQRLTANERPLQTAIRNPQSEMGAVRFIAKHGNAPGVVTELLLQRLPNERRRPKSQYKTVGFFAFTEETNAVDIPVEPGFYVPGYAFVEQSTGRTTAGVVFEMVEVGGLTIVDGRFTIDRKR